MPEFDSALSGIVFALCCGLSQSANKFSLPYIKFHGSIVSSIQSKLHSLVFISQATCVSHRANIVGGVN